MKVSTKGRYASRAMLDLAEHYGQGPTLLKDIAEREEISVKYLEQLMGSLRAAGLVRSIRGSKGGYVLSRSPGRINLHEILLVLEGSLAPVECVREQQLCSRSHRCVMRDVWADVDTSFERILKAKTLESLVKRKKVKESSL